MPDVPSIGHGRVGPVNRAAAASAYQGTPKAREPGGRLGDRVELSRHATLLDRLRRLPDVRPDLVGNVRQAILDGTYETPEKLEVAAQRLLEDLGAWGYAKRAPV